MCASEEALKACISTKLGRITARLSLGDNKTIFQKISNNAKQKSTGGLRASTNKFILERAVYLLFDQKHIKRTKTHLCITFSSKKNIYIVQMKKDKNESKKNRQTVHQGGKNIVFFKNRRTFTTANNHILYVE